MLAQLANDPGPDDERQQQAPSRSRPRANVNVIEEIEKDVLASERREQVIEHQVGVEDTSKATPRDALSSTARCPAAQISASVESLRIGGGNQRPPSASRQALEGACTRRPPPRPARACVGRSRAPLRRAILPLSAPNSNIVPTTTTSAGAAGGPPGGGLHRPGQRGGVGCCRCRRSHHVAISRMSRALRQPHARERADRRGRDRTPARCAPPGRSGRFRADGCQRRARVTFSPESVEAGVPVLVEIAIEQCVVVAFCPAGPRESPGCRRRASGHIVSGPEPMTATGAPSSSDSFSRHHPFQRPEAFDVGEPMFVMTAMWAR